MSSTIPDSSPPNHDHHLLKGVQKTLSSELFHKINTSKILLVGSGGIGCELLKNLALSGFRDVEVIDLDTIDVSNLNRQFLFRRKHVGMPKCKVACAAALAMIPTSTKQPNGDTTNNDDDDKTTTNGVTPTYQPHHGNVCDNTRFNVQYISTFDLVLNALDNVPARRRVNRLCLAASVPLVEAGTTGYLGQVTVIDKPSNVECYECQTKPTQKVYPICTIRSTPSMPVHTIVWAKELYKLCFGGKVEDSMLFEDQTQEGAEMSTYMDLVMQFRSMLSNDTGSTYGDSGSLRTITGKLFIALYNTEIEKQLGMDRFKTAQKIPTSVPVELIEKSVERMEEATTILPPSRRDGYKSTDMFSMQMCVEELMDCFVEGANAVRAAVTSSSSGDDASSPCLPDFDKDDALAMRIVTYSSNLRSYVFSIDPIQSYYSAKGIAGNIIPAIATTNAIVAGLQVLQAFHILQQRCLTSDAGGATTTATTTGGDGGGGLKDVCRYTYCLRDKTRKGFYLLPTILPDPNPDCFVCRNAIISVILNTSKWTLEMLLRRIIKKELGFMEPTILIGDDIILEEGEGADISGYMVNLPKTLCNLPAGGVVHGTVIVVEDFTQDLEVTICISHKEVWESNEEEEGDGEDGEEEEKFKVTKRTVAKNDGASKPSGSVDDTCEDNRDNDNAIEIVSANDDSRVFLKKRELNVDDTMDDGGPKKKLKAGQQ